MSPIVILLTSAVVSALVSALLSLLGQYLERKSREEQQCLERESKRKELLLLKAIELAITRTQLVADLAVKTESNFILHDSVINAKRYYKDLELLLTVGDISEDTKNKNAGSSKKTE
jgi:hypothetical protein